MNTMFGGISNMNMELFEPPKSKVAFGSSVEREMFPGRVPRTRFGNEMCPLRGSPHAGPGSYNTEEHNNFLSKIEKHPESNKGYVLGARSAIRFISFSKHVAPPPGTYQSRHTKPRTFKTSFKPFDVGSDRFPVRRQEIMEVMPGPGTYDHEIPHCRQVQWHQAFGSTPIMMPTVSHKSTIEKNTDKLYSTKEEKRYHRKLAYLKLWYD